jgi:hypothetical protein
MENHTDIWELFERANPKLIERFNSSSAQFMDRHHRYADIDLKRIFESLLQLGIPVKAIEIVLWCLSEKLLETEDGSTITTDDIRKHVSDCIYQLEGDFTRSFARSFGTRVVSGRSLIN